MSTASIRFDNGPFSPEEEMQLCSKVRGKIATAFGTLRSAFEKPIENYIQEKLVDHTPTEANDIVERIFWTAKSQLIHESTRRSTGSWATIEPRCKFLSRVNYDSESGFSSFLRKIADNVVFEANLCRRVQNGDREALDCLVFCFQKAVKGHIHGRIRELMLDREDLEHDVMFQDTFERAVKNLRKGKYNVRYPFRTFLRNIAKYIVLENASDKDLPCLAASYIPWEMKSIIRIEFLRLLFLLADNPHEPLISGYLTLDWSAGDLAGNKQWREPLDQLATDLEAECHKRICLVEAGNKRQRRPSACLCKTHLFICRPLGLKTALSGPIHAAYDPLLSSALAIQGFKKAGDVTFAGLSYSQSQAVLSKSALVRLWDGNARQRIADMLTDGGQTPADSGELFEGACEEHYATSSILEFLTLLISEKRYPFENHAFTQLYDHLHTCAVCESRLLALLYIENNLRRNESSISAMSRLPRGIRRYFGNPQSPSTDAHKFHGEPQESIKAALQRYQQELKFSKAELRALLEPAIASGAKPHQVLSFGYVWFLGWKPGEFVEDDRMGWSLGDLLSDFLKLFHKCWEVPFNYGDYTNLYCIPLLAGKLAKPVEKIYPESEYQHVKLYAGAKNLRLTGEMPFNIFFPQSDGKSLEDTISDWNHKVIKRIKSIIEGTRSPESD